MMQASGDYFFCCQILSEPTAIVLFLPQNSRGEARDGMCLAYRGMRERQVPCAICELRSAGPRYLRHTPCSLAQEEAEGLVSRREMPSLSSRGAAS